MYKKYKNKAEKVDFRLAFDQANLGYIYESAKARMDANLEYTEQQKKVFNECLVFKNEKDAVEAALKLPEEDILKCRILAKVTKDEEHYAVKSDRWFVVYEGNSLKAAEYLGMVVMYDYAELKDIIDNL